MRKLTLPELQDRAARKLEAKVFFETNKLKEYKMMSDGIIDHGIAQETINKMIEAQEFELQTYHYIMHRLTFND